MTNSVDVYIVQALTDLHAGTGSEYTRNIDKVIQRDYAGIPVVKGSGVKGALRGHVQNVLSQEEINALFGAFIPREEQQSVDGRTKKFIASSLYLSDMQMVAVACNFNDQFPYVLATCPMLLQRAANAIDLSASDTSPGTYTDSVLRVGDMRTQLQKCGGGVYAQDANDFSLAKAVIEKLKALGVFSDAFPMAVVSDANFICDVLPNSLPVVARNSLQRGISKNLWFEEYVPAASIFMSQVAYHDKSAGKVAALRNRLDTRAGNGWTPPVRMGGGKSVGKGETLWKLAFQKISPSGKTSQDDFTTTSANQGSTVTSGTFDENAVTALNKGLRDGSSARIQDLIKVCVKKRFITEEYGELVLPDESATALHRLPSLMRGSLYQIVSTLAADQKEEPENKSEAAAKTSRLLSRNAVSVLVEKYLCDKYEDSDLTFQTLAESLISDKAKRYMDLRKHINKAVNELKLISAFCREPKHKAA